jgi:plastocyanin
MTSLSRLSGLARLTLGILVTISTAFTVGCSDSSNNNTPGAGGGGGGGTTGSGGSGGGIPFMAVVPCSTEATYMTGSTVEFGGTVGFNYSPKCRFNYSPKCLKVVAGATVTFNGDFAMHPLEASAARGTLGSNPIPTGPLNTGTTASFTFPTAGFWGYRCAFHGADDGQFMDGVIWAN